MGFSREFYLYENLEVTEFHELRKLFLFDIK